MKIAEAVARRIEWIRKPYWNTTARLKLDILPADPPRHGPWGHLYDEPTQSMIGEPTPQTFFLGLEGDADWVDARATEEER